MKFSRRGLFGFAGAAAFTTAIPAKVLALVLPKPMAVARSSPSLMTINQINREAIRIFRSSNAFLANISLQYDQVYGAQAEDKNHDIRPSGRASTGG